MNNFIKIITAVIPGKERRKRARTRLRSIVFGMIPRLRAAAIGKNVMFGDYVKVNKKTYIGDYSSMYDLVVAGHGELRVGKRVIFGPNVTILTDNHNYKGEVLPFDNTFVDRGVIIEDLVWVGMNVQILPGTHIGEGAVIQMGSVVHGDIPACAIAGGNPAKVFASRDIETYMRLKAEGRFLRPNV